MIIHYNCTIYAALVFADLPSDTCFTNFPLRCGETGAPGRTKNAMLYARMRISCVLAKTAPLLSKPSDKSNGVFFWPLVPSAF